MDGFEFNKIAGAVLGALLVTMLIGISSEAIFSHGELEKPGYVVEVAGAEPTEAPAEVVVASIAERMQTADAGKGETGIRRCAACHDFTQGGPNKVGPNLWGVVDRGIGTHEGFGYSEVLAGHLAAGDVWSYENLDGFLENPRAWAPGTAMGFAGIADPEDRANVIAYLRSLADTPVPLPEVGGDTAAATEAAPAETAPADAAPADAAAAPAEPVAAPETTSEPAPAPAH